MALSHSKIRISLLLAMMPLLAACTRVENFSDLQSFVDDVKGRPGAEVEPVPVFVPYEGFIYSAASLRSPFDEPIVINSDGETELAQNVQPDLDRIKEELENQSLSELSMVGMLHRRGIYEALIEDGLGVVHRVGVGRHLGRNFGRIESISETQLNIIEIVPSGDGGWVERPQTLMLPQTLIL